MSGTAAGHSDPVQALLAVYDEALPAVYGYLLRRCANRTVAEDLTSETFLAAMDTARRAAFRDSPAPDPTTRWLIGVARHKLADHWRRAQRTPEPVADPPEPGIESGDDPWEIELDRMLAESTLASLSPVNRAVLTLRYVDDLPVAECAAVLQRSTGATEALLTRAKRAFRAAYPASPHPASARQAPTPKGGRP